LGSAADYVKILPESDQSLYRSRMYQVLRHATDVIERGKVFLVVSPFSHQKTKDGVETLTFLQAMGIANVMTVVPGPEDSLEILGGRQVIITADNIHRGTGGSAIEWDNESATVTFSYRADDETRTVWVENVFSVGFKLELAQVFRLGGIAIEDVSEGSGGADIWAAMDSLLSGVTLLVVPNSDDLRPEWTASGGTIEAPGTGGAATWIPPEEGGTYEISLIVSDGATRVGRRLTLEVQATVTPTPSPTPEATLPPEETPTAEVTATPAAEASPTPEETGTPTAEASPTPEETGTPTAEASPTPEETGTPTGEATPTPEEVTPTPEEATPTPEETETATATPEGETPTATP
jgi:hypothetical protein